MTNSSKNGSDKSNIVPIVTSLFVLIGTLATVYYGYIANHDAVLIPIATTQTAEARSAAQTNFLPTDEAAPTVLIVPTDSPMPTLAPSQDWANNCISSSIWRPYLAGKIISTSPACYDLSEWGITADQGTLVFASVQCQISAFEYGIFTAWKNWRQVDFSINAAHLDNSEIWFGFFEGDTISSRGVVFVIQHDNMIDIRETPRNKEIINNTHLKFADGKYNVQVVFQKGEIFVTVDEQGIISQYPLNFTIHNMFIGYRSLPVINLEATISNLMFTP